MKFATEFRDSALAKKLLDGIRRKSTRPANIMEFCGGHTVAIFRYGLRDLLPPHLKLLSGPGCPVCVTSTADLDKVMALARIPGVTITTFGDLIKVPASYGSLDRARAAGADVRTVYSTLDALDIARNNPGKKVVFVGIGFETTAPTVAAAILQADAEKLQNFSVISLHKVTPPVTRALLDAGEVKIQGIICPGHVSAIIGADAWYFIPGRYGIACAVSGFEPLDILHCVDMIVDQIESGAPRVQTAYSRAVRAEGNPQALAMLDRVFEVAPADWRGVGSIPESGLAIREEFAAHDAEKVFEIKLEREPREPAGCLCGEVIRAVKTPEDCKLFRKACTPENPVGPCMVSSEGSCAAYYHFAEAIG
ncbi:hydrogenase formation protein HypD [Dehalogenimonas alkenigignens]|uniref:hydrogenase formation protein HypD n=1 Tax=Dehalogenimonas alkenigignens TaxID=1217799 RepID=UPI000D572C6E|nr:hydrogenase formation protein HypD [Dehalogenimonas alkenigignens]PVV82872.1 hydrogenase formation protein HypD [Dehalogenimonas alkenigignens]